MMQSILLFFTIVLLLLMLPVMYRIVKGPTIIDRMIGVNIIGAKTTVLLVLIGGIYGQLDMYIDLAITYALLNFLGSLASARFIQRRKTSIPAQKQILGGAND